MKQRIFTLLILLGCFTTLTHSQWFIVSSGGAVGYNSVSFYQSTGFAAGDLGLIKKSVDQGLTWTSLTLGASTKINDVYTYNQNTVYMCGVDAMIYKSTNAGTNWTAQTTAAAYRYYDMDFINSTTGMVVGDDGRAGFTANGGTNWIQAQLNVTPGAKLDYKVCDMIDVNSWVVASADTQISNIQYSYIHRTTNNGTSYQNLYTMIGGLTSDVSFIYIRVMSSTTIYAVTANGYFLRTIDNGVNWTAVQIPTIPVTVSFANMSTGYCGGINGVVRKTTNGGLNWIQQNSPTTATINSVFCTDTINAYAAGSSGTIIRTQNGGTFVGMQQINSEIPNAFGLSQNYPNPFNPSTKIRFNIASASFVKLSVFNVLGQEVKVLLNDYLSSGFYEADMDASSLPGGTYFYRLNAGEFSETRKMVLLK